MFAQLPSWYLEGHGSMQLPPAPGIVSMEPSTCPSGTTPQAPHGITTRWEYLNPVFLESLDLETC